MNLIARWALALYGISLLVVGGLVAIVIQFRVPNPEELLRDVADRRPMWIAANALLIVQQVLLVVAAPALGRAGGRPVAVAADAVRGLLAIAAGAFIASGTFHAVLGAHLASEVTSGPLDPDLVRSAKVLHALGDTTWFIGLGALTAMTAVCAAVWWRADDRGTRRRARLGALAGRRRLPAVRLVLRSRPRPLRRPGRPAPEPSGSSRSPPRRRDNRPLPSSRRRPPDHSPWAHDARRCPSGDQVSPTRFPSGARRRQGPVSMAVAATWLQRPDGCSQGLRVGDRLVVARTLPITAPGERTAHEWRSRPSQGPDQAGRR